MKLILLRIQLPYLGSMKASLGIQVNYRTQPPSVASFMIMTTINSRTGTPNAASHSCGDVLMHRLLLSPSKSQPPLS